MDTPEDKIPLAADSEEHIYSYDTKKRPKPNTPKRKEFKIVCMVLGGVGIYLLLFSIFLKFRGGFTDSNFNDINSNCRYAMSILSIFVIFIAFAGYSGAYTNWKPIILTFSVLTSMALLGHLYVAKKFLDAVRFTERDMAISWWDVYTDYIRAEIQDKYSCCGYKNYNDLPVASVYCKSQEVEYVLRYSDGIKDPADVKNNDSYRKKFGTANSVDGVNKGGAQPAKDNKPDNAGAGAGAAGGAADAGNAGGADAGAGAAADGNNAAAGKADAGNGGADAGADAGGAGGAGGAPDNGNQNAVAMAKRDGSVFRYEEMLRKRQVQQEAKDNQIEQNYAILQATGCKDVIVPKIKKTIKFIYIINYSLSLIYAYAIYLSLVYWQYMRKEKEFDEFA